MMPSLYNHRKYYQKEHDRKFISKYNIDSGMIVTFRYPGNKVKRPLVFVMDTDEYVTPATKKTFSGINLNYLTIGELNNFFIKMLNKVGWEVDNHTGRPKVDLWDDEDPGFKPKVIYDSLVKKPILSKRDCWRKYKYNKISQAEQVTFDFQVEPLSELKNIKSLGTTNMTEMLKMLKNSNKDENKL